MDPEFDFNSYNYKLPLDKIAQFPAEKRDQSRLLILDCFSNTMRDKKFSEIVEFFQPGDLVVVNDTKVFPARLEGQKESGGKIELFLLEYPDFNGAVTIQENSTRKVTGKHLCIKVTGLLKSSKKPKVGSRLLFSPYLEAELLELLTDGKVTVKLYFDISDGGDPENILLQTGRIPLPPYIRRNKKDAPMDRERYQTVYASKSGAVAAPTAGLHFSSALLHTLQENSIQIAPITLHVGYGTFAPVRVEDIRQHKIHEEYVEISPQTAKLINQTRKSGKRVWTVGTTTARALEFAADDKGEIKARKGWCGLYIYPGYKFKIVNALITNFHLPGSSLLFLVAALAGKSRILKAYKKAIQLDYRFYSYGDAMLIIT